MLHSSTGPHHCKFSVNVVVTKVPAANCAGDPGPSSGTPMSHRAMGLSCPDETPV